MYRSPVTHNGHSVSFTDWAYEIAEYTEDWIKIIFMGELASYANHFVLHVPNGEDYNIFYITFARRDLGLAATRTLGDDAQCATGCTC